MEAKKDASTPAEMKKSHRCPPCIKEPLIWRTMKFGNKLLIAGSLVYYTSRHGAWGTPEESLEFVNKVSSHIYQLVPAHIAMLVWPENEK